jgi:thioredoxin-like negative regulator of GroEL
MAAESVKQSADKRAKAEPASALEQGIAAIRRGDHAQGQALLKPIAASGAGSDRSTAMLWLARSLRERGDCAAALTFYKTLTQAVTAPRAVLEDADCQQRTGNAAAAERLRGRAALQTKQ